MAVHLITGYKGSEHIQSKDARSFNTAMFGDGEFVMEIGEQLDASIINNNTVRVLDGDILMQGGHIRIETDSYEDMTIQTGTAGTNRIDLIVMTYEKNSSDGTEQAYLEVIKGTETSGTPSAPEYITGDIAAGDLKNQMPLYKVTVEGVVLSDIESMFTTIPTYKTLAEEAAAIYKAKLEALQGTDILDTYEEIEANTQSLKFAGALGVKEGFNQINSNLSPLLSSHELYVAIETSNVNLQQYRLRKYGTIVKFEFHTSFKSNRAADSTLYTLKYSDGTAISPISDNTGQTMISYGTIRIGASNTDLLYVGVEGKVMSKVQVPANTEVWGSIIYDTATLKY